MEAGQGFVVDEEGFVSDVLKLSEEDLGVCGGRRMGLLSCLTGSQIYRQRLAVLW